MPVEFDPAWEYFVPADEEVAELFDGRRDGVRDYDLAFGDDDKYRTTKRGLNPGIRFGLGEKQFRSLFFRLGRAKKNRGRFSTLTTILCPTCGREFMPHRKEQVHCSDDCYKRPGAVRVRADSAVCLYERCRKEFAPNRVGQAYCSRACGSKAAAAAGENVGVKHDRAEVARLFDEGVGTTEIARRLGTTRQVVRRILNELGKPKLKPGRKICGKPC